MKIALREIKGFRLDGELISYAISVSSVARYVRLKISLDEGLKITIPKYFPLSRIEHILLEKKPWILRKMQEAKSLRHHARSLEDGSMLQILEKPFVLRLHPDRRDFVRLGLDTGEIHVHTQHFSQRHMKTIVRQWLIQEAKKYFSERLHLTSRELNIPYKKLFIRGQKTRWGTASTRGNISLNYRLLLAPLFVGEYVMIHELTHLIHMNHSKKFWALVEKRFPRYKEARKWLRNEGRFLNFV